MIEKPIEKIVYRDREVPIEIIKIEQVEKIVEKPVIVTETLVKEVFKTVEVPIEVVKI